ncbi:Hox cluster protein ShxD [Operophtera brumata]|uniref:Hox cluster protein ShxD n=1 Tax=Operophtera brumata TaxID=104452 RepID=A0A0L7LKL6_OPEBR|nr:Hox cluster protein ShxD [Operophtera brumata]
MNVVIPTATGNFKAIVKRKRKRTVFRTDQVEAMEEVFTQKPYVTKEDRKALVDSLQISDKSVKVWFQNRRLKIKKGDDQYFSEEEHRSSPGLDRLDYVESKIHERTNEFGYVTLDDRIMNDLVQLIDDYMHRPKPDSSMEETKMEVADISIEEAKMKYESIPVYEPISPASTIDNSNEESSWECQSPVVYEYLQRLIDIESIISQ